MSSLLKLADSRGNLYRIHPSKIHVSDAFNGRYNQASDDVQELAQSMIRGQLQPCGVRSVRSGRGSKVELVFGFRRWQAADYIVKNIDPEFTLLVVVAEQASDEISALVANIEENRHRKGLSPVEEARNVERLLSSGMTGREVGIVYGKDESWVSGIRRLLTLPDNIISRVDDGELAYSAALEIARAPDAIRSKIAKKVAAISDRPVSRPEVVGMVRTAKDKARKAGQGDQVKGKAGKRSEARVRTAKEFRRLAEMMIGEEENSDKIAHVGAQLAKYGAGKLSEEGVIRNLKKAL